MKIWFDLSNSPHINMFYDLIRELEADGHTIIITSRPLANTVELLDQKGLKHTVVGEHYGKNFLKKIFGYPIRVMQLRNFLRSQKPDLAVSQSSFHSPVVAKLLGIPSIYTNDNEHAMGNKPSFYCATSILIPENLPVENVAKFGIPAKKVTQYPGVKEGIYLWSKGEAIREQRSRPRRRALIYIYGLNRKQHNIIKGRKIFWMIRSSLYRKNTRSRCCQGMPTRQSITHRKNFLIPMCPINQWVLILLQQIAPCSLVPGAR